MKDSCRFLQEDFWTGIVSVYAMIRFLTATFGHANIQIARSIRKKTLSHRIRSRSHKYVLTLQIQYQ